MMGNKMVIFCSLVVLWAIVAADESRTIDYEINIDIGILKSVKQLRKTDVLDLSRRRISEIDDGAFKNVSVKILNLRNNEIYQIGPATFSGLGVDLEELILDSTRINIVGSPFIGLMNLKLLNFANNPSPYLGVGDFAGIPHTADIIVTGNVLYSLSTRIFEEPVSDPFDEESIQGATRIAKSELNSWTHSLVELAEKAQILLTDEILDHDRKLPLGHVGRMIVCVEDSILKKVGILEDGKVLPKNCSVIEINSGLEYLELQNRGIRGVTKGWYQLQQIYIVYIDLSKNNFTELSPEILNDLPEGVKTVDLSHNLIKNIRKDVFSNFYLKEIRLEANLIENVKDGSFKSSNLWVLNLAENKISDISFSASLPVSLNKLHLKKNQILSIPDGVFSRLQNLSHLDLDQNHITELQSNVFKGLTSLVALDLGHNQISEIEAGAFLALKNVIAINLNGNSISICESGAFDGLEKLTSLHLSLNKFTSITKTNFDKLPASLLFLDLDNNEITHIDSDVFIGVPRNTLKLNNNKLSKILPDQFKIKDLEKLYLKNNSITKINQDSFLGLSAIKYLSLDNNQISEIPRGTLRNLNALSRFDISRNPITKLKNGALYGISMDSDSQVFVDENKLQVIQGGTFENV